MFKRAIVAAVLISGLMLPVEVSAVLAQESGAAKPSVVNAYRIDFSINEIEDGKKINSRQYSMNLNAPDGNEIKIGTRVPFEQKQGEFEYIDVGTRISCRIKDQVDQPALGNQVSLSVMAEISNFAVPEQQAQAGVRPLLRQFKISGSTVALPGKSVVVGSVDDPNSKRQFQLEVTVTKLK
jgi:hypothetical protein